MFDDLNAVDTVGKGEEVTENQASENNETDAQKEENRIAYKTRKAIEAAEKRVRDAEERASKAEESLRNKDKLLGGYRDAIHLYGFQGDDDDELQAQMVASHEGIDVSQVKAERKRKDAELNDMVNNHPDVVKAREANKIREGEIIRMNDLNEIKAAHPELKVDDIRKIENFDRFADLRANHGFDALEAYEIANQVKHKERRTDDKEHFIPTGGTAGENNSDREIPKDILEAWQEAFPNESEKQLKARYNRYIKR